MCLAKLLPPRATGGIRGCCLPCFVLLSELLQPWREEGWSWGRTRSLGVFCIQGCEWVLYLTDDSPPSTLVTASQLRFGSQAAGDLGAVRSDRRLGDSKTAPGMQRQGGSWERKRSGLETEGWRKRAAKQTLPRFPRVAGDPAPDHGEGDKERRPRAQCLHICKPSDPCYLACRWLPGPDLAMAACGKSRVLPE